jgi:2-hydroxychromene-2-carboxylate isomerase
LAFVRPSRFPRNGLLAARIALIARTDGWAGAFTRAVYHANFAEDREISDVPTLSDILRSLGRDPDSVLARAQSTENKDALRRQTDEAVALGIFGAPSFIAGRELFWGNDRLEEALEWCAQNAV